MEKVSFCTAVNFGDHPKSYSQSLLETVDSYFNLWGAKACVIPGHAQQGSEGTTLTQKSSPSFITTALKIATYLTVIIPAIMLIFKAVLRSIHTFHFIQTPDAQKPDAPSNPAQTTYLKTKQTLEEGIDISEDTIAKICDNSASFEKVDSSYRSDDTDDANASNDKNLNSGISTTIETEQEAEVMKTIQFLPTPKQPASPIFKTPLLSPKKLEAEIISQDSIAKICDNSAPLEKVASSQSNGADDANASNDTSWNSDVPSTIATEQEAEVVKTIQFLPTPKQPASPILNSPLLSPKKFDMKLQVELSEPAESVTMTQRQLEDREKVFQKLLKVATESPENLDDEIQYEIAEKKKSDGITVSDQGQQKEKEELFERFMNAAKEDGFYEKTLEVVKSYTLKTAKLLGITFSQLDEIFSKCLAQKKAQRTTVLAQRKAQRATTVKKSSIK